MSMKNKLQGAGIVGLLLIANMALAGTTANVGFTNNYIWRGVTQTNDQSAISGGVDYSHEAGFSVGAWVSNVDFGGDGANDTGTELDIYGGYSFEAGSVPIDVGFINYNYPSQSNIDFLEIYATASINTASINIVSFGGYYTLSKDGTSADNDLYLMVSVGLDLGNDIALGLTYGNYGYDDDVNNEDYGHIQVSISKGDLTFAVDQNDLSGGDGNTNNDDPRFTVSYSKEIDWLK